MGRHELATLKLRHPEVIPVRDRMAAPPLRLASWVRFETVMDRHQWSTAIALLVPSIHLPDDALLVLLNQCVPDQGITSMEEAQALLLRNFRVGGAQESECTKWLTAVARDLLRPIPFREVFVILALFLPQLPFAEGAQVAKIAERWRATTRFVVVCVICSRLTPAPSVCVCLCADPSNWTRHPCQLCGLPRRRMVSTGRRPQAASELTRSGRQRGLSKSWQLGKGAFDVAWAEGAVGNHSGKSVAVVSPAAIPVQRWESAVI